MINLASPNDLMQIKHVAHEVYASYVPRFSKVAPEPVIKDYSVPVSQRRLYAFRQPDIRGFIVCFANGDDYDIDNVVVLPKFQRTGIGQQLLTFAEKQAHEARCHRLAVSAHIAMHENIAFYKQHGFVVTSQEADEAGIERVFLEMGLNR